MRQDKPKRFSLAFADRYPELGLHDYLGKTIATTEEPAPEAMPDAPPPRFSAAFAEKFPESGIGELLKKPQIAPGGIFKTFSEVVPRETLRSLLPKKSSPRRDVMEAVAKSVSARREPAVTEPAVAVSPPAPPLMPEEDAVAKALRERKAELAEAESLRDERTRGANLFEAAGQIFQGVSQSQQPFDASFYDKLRSQAAQGVADVTTRQKAASEELAQLKTQQEMARTRGLNDPKSPASFVARNIARRRLAESGGDPNMITDAMSALDVAELERGVSGLESTATRKQIAADARASRENALRIAQLEREAARERREQERREAREAREGERREARETREEEKREARMTPFGEAQTEDDAKKLKDAAEIKDSFDRQLNELIELRRRKGAEVMDREAVARASALANDLLLKYKDMSKLGVLSKSDERILNAIIPSDPLQWNASSLMGQDPTLTKLVKFREDVEADFKNRLATRLRRPGASASRASASSAGFPRIVKKGTQAAIVSNAEEYREALAEGFQ
jgi:hypothetical protein